jgi:hypothetical protein
MPHVTAVEVSMMMKARDISFMLKSSGKEDDWKTGRRRT